MAKDKISFFQGIGGKIALVTVVIAALSIGAVAVLSVVQSSNALMAEAEDQLVAVRELKKNQLQLQFEDHHAKMDFLVETVLLLQMEAYHEMHAVQKQIKSEVERYFRDNDVTDDMLFQDGPVHQRVDAILEHRDLLGTTGETYLMSEEGGRYHFRSDMETMGDGAFVFGADQTELALGVEYIQRAARGESGEDVFTDSAGRLVLVVYDTLSISGRNWFIITKKDFEEAIAVKIDGADDDFFQEFMEDFHYYDVFLIHPAGSVFYTVTHEADYGTNMLTGPYADSGLGKVTRKVLETREFAFADFEPYEPSNGAPASFLAEPVMHNGEVELIVALQLSLETINEVMTQRAGMGESGETYLVGPDLLMRSDSYLDPVNHSVAGSFASPELGSVDTVAANRALQGRTGQATITDYVGGTVLSAYTPIKVFGTEWALIAEIDIAEVRAPVRSLVVFIVLSAVVVILIAIIAAYLFSRTISKPILTIVEGADRLAIGDIALQGIDQNAIKRINERSDELGRIGRSFNNLIEYQQEKAAVAESIAAKNLNVDVTVSSEQDTLGKAFKNMTQSLNELLIEVRASVENVTSGAGQVSQASQSLSQGAAEQASSLEEISSSMNEINSQAKQNAENANEATEIAGSAADDAQKGNGQMQELVETMEKINASSDEIAKIVKVIDDIAFQINLLALNANVEAARAGKYGKGFAVVAEEVRNLATRSAESVQETTKIVEETTKNIGEGTQSVRDTADQLGAISESVVRLTQVLGEIAAASREQAQGVEQTNGGLDQIDQVTQANTASSEESASAAEELASQAETLRGLIATFTLADTAAAGGGNGAGSAQVAAGGNGAGGEEAWDQWSDEDVAELPAPSRT